MKLIFELSMPNNNAWNGRWSGEGRFYGRIRNVGTSKKAIAKVQPILQGGYFYYNFGDGWGAAVTVREATKEDSRRVSRESVGFCGYDWMIDSIMEYGEILNSNQQRVRRSGIETVPVN